MNLKDEVSKILGFRVQDWDTAQKELYVMGRPDGKQMKELVFLLLKYVSQHE